MPDKPEPLSDEEITAIWNRFIGQPYDGRTLSAIIAHTAQAVAARYEARIAERDELVQKVHQLERERDALRADAGPGIEAAAAWVDKRREAFDAEHGHHDPDTGAFEYGVGSHAQAKAEYSAELAEIADGIRALAARAAQEKPAC